MKSQNKFKTELTIEESARLIELGVDPKLASEVMIDYIDPYDIDDAIERKNPIYTLTDILSILPKEIDKRDLGMDYDSEFNQWCVGYNVLHLESAPELIDALNQLLIWCLEQGYCKCGKGGGK